ncbi:MAG: PAS domain-containing protein [Opitutales bacterium]
MGLVFLAFVLWLAGREVTRPDSLLWEGGALELPYVLELIWLSFAIGSGVLLRGAFRHLKADRAEREGLQREQVLLHSAFNELPVATGIVDANGILQRINPGFEQLVGLPAAKIVGRAFTEFLAPECWDGVENRHQRLCTAGVPEGTQRLTIVRSDGRCRSVSATSALAAVRGRPLKIVSLHDVTDSERIRDTLEAAEQVAHIGNWSYDITAGVARWSAQVFRIYGLDPAEGEPSVEAQFAAYHPADRPRLQERFRRAIADGEAFDFDARLTDAFQRQRYVLVKADVRRDREGAPVEIFGTLQDITERRSFEEALQRAEGRLDSLIRSMPAIVFRTSRSDVDRFEFISSRVDDLTGFSSAGFCSQEAPAWADLLEPDGTPGRRTAIEQQLRQADQYRVEYRLRHRDGSERWVLEQATSRDGNTIDGVMIDMTESRQNQMQLREVRQRLETATEFAGVGIFEYFSDTGQLYWDENMCRLFQASREELTGTNLDWIQRLHPDDRRQMRPETVMAGEPPEFFDQVSRFVMPDGSVRYIQGRARRTGNEAGGTRMLGAAWDVTEQMQREVELNAVSRRLQLATASAGIGIFEWDVVEGTLLWTEEMYDLYGIRKDQFEPSYAFWCKFVLSEDLRSVEAGMSRSFESGGSFHSAFRIRRADGEIRHLSVHAVSLDGGRRVLGINFDVTSERLAAEAMREARDRAEEAARAKSAFLAAMSHEIRTPMNGVIGMANILDDTKLDAEQQEFVRIIRTSGETLLTLINDILDFSKIDAGKLSLLRSPFDLRSNVQQSLDMLAHQAHAKRLELAYLIHDEVPSRIVGDETRVRQVLMNLLSNAIKFTEEGEVFLEITCLERWGEQCRLQFMVRDTGRGIPKNKHHLLFESFSQIDENEGRHSGGTGLGLAICKRLVHMMGGSIWVESDDGEGAAFFFTLTAPIASSRVAVTAKDKDVLSGKRIFLLDSDASRLADRAAAARNRGAKIDGFLSSSAALAALERGRFYDAGFAELPEKDARTLREFVVKLRAHRAGKDLSLVLAGPNAAALDGLARCVSTSPEEGELHRLLREAVQAQTEPAGPREPELDLDEKRTTVLLAEDNRVNQRVTSLLLDRLGFDCDCVEDGQQAIEAVTEGSYPIVLMDLQMPVLDGLQATRRIREQVGDECRPYIIALTAEVLESDRDRAEESGMDDFVSKPVSLKDLQVALRLAEAETALR